MSTSAPLTVYIADDHKIIRDGLRALLEREPSCRLVGEAADGRTLVTNVPALKPDVLIADMAMPELNGLEAVRQLRAAGYAGVIIMLSMHSERRVVAQALAAGMNDFVSKPVRLQDLRRTLLATPNRNAVAAA